YEQLNVARCALRREGRMHISTLPFWPISRHNWGGARRNEADEPGASSAPTVPRHVHSVMTPHRKIARISKRFAVRRMATPPLRTSADECGRVRTSADENAAAHLASHTYDQELATCTNRQAIKALLARRHAEWQQTHRLAVVQPPAQLSHHGRRSNG